LQKSVAAASAAATFQVLIVNPASLLLQIGEKGVGADLKLTGHKTHNFKLFQMFELILTSNHANKLK
jgi:hypothetical protein